MHLFKFFVLYPCKIYTYILMYKLNNYTTYLNYGIYAQKQANTKPILGR